MAGQTHRWISSDGDVNAATSFDSGIKPGERATETLIAAANLVDNDTVTLGVQVYRFKDTMTTVGDVQIAGSATLTMANLTLAVNLTGVAGTNYFVGLGANARATAVDGASDDMVATAKIVGTTGNSYTSTQTGSGNATWGGATLSGGVQNWATDDRLVCDGVESNVSISINADMTGLQIQKFVTLEAFTGDVGTPSAPLILRAGTNNDPTVINGSGKAYLGNDNFQSNVFNTVVVGSSNNDDALEINSNAFVKLLVKSGKVTLASTLTMNEAVGVVATVGPQAVLVLTDTKGPLLVCVVDGLCISSASQHFISSTGLWIVVGPRGKLEQTQAPDLNGGAILNMGGTISFKPPTNAAFSGNLFLMDGNNDFSTPFDHTAGAMDIVIGPNARVNLGLIEVGENVTVDLRKEIPIGCD